MKKLHCFLVLLSKSIFVFREIRVFFSPLDSKTSAKLCSLHGSQPTAESLLFNVSELEPKGHLYIILGSPPLVIPKTSSSLFHTEEEQDCNGFLL